MIFSEKLQLIRKNKGLTQEELAEKIISIKASCSKMGIGTGIFMVA